MPDHSGGSVEAQAGPASFRASGHTVINVLLAIAIVSMSFYGIWTTNQQSLMIHQEHYAIMLNLGQLTRANENVFLSTMLPNERKKDVPPFIQDRAQEIITNRAATITGNTPTSTTQKGTP
jgi:hypothetical protein